MNLKTIYHRIQHNRSLPIGFLIVIILGSAIALEGRRADQIARTMNRTILFESGRDRYGSVLTELHRTELATRTTARFIASDTLPTDAHAEIFMQTILQMDPKISSISLFPLPTGIPQIYAAPAETLEQRHLLHSLQSLSTAPTSDTTPVYHLLAFGENYYLCILQHVAGQDGQKFLLSLNLSLAGMHTYFSEQKKIAKSYITLTDHTGLVLVHPDTAWLGRTIPLHEELQQLGPLHEYGTLLPHSVYSDFLDLPVDRIYYALPFSQEQLILSVSFPRLVIQEQINDFHLHTIIIACLIILLIVCLLILAQRRWRNEYRLRQKAEQESTRMHIQQLINQINPHFLFNSLNSLHALINTDPRLAREFVLKLSKVYRYVLETGHTALATVRDEIAFTRQYYFLQKIRFGDQIELHIEIAPEAEERRIPAMGIQTLVENAIKHNRATSESPLKIVIRTDTDRIIIENTFQPRQDSDETSLGIGLNRLRTIYRLYTDRPVIIQRLDDLFRCELPLLDRETN